MTLHTPKTTKPAAKRSSWANASPAKMGDVLGDQLRAALAEKARKRELAALGFRPVGGR